MQAPPIIASPPRLRIWWLFAILGAAAAALVLFLFNPSQHGFYPRCVLYLTTGLYCPGCGGLRATHQLLHGHLLTALHCNALFVLSLPFLGAYFLRRAACWLNDEPVPPFVVPPKWIVVLTILTVCFTILRNIPIAPFNWLAPVP
jgi:hypothetical protein